MGTGHRARRGRGRLGLDVPVLRYTADDVRVGPAAVRVRGLRLLPRTQGVEDGPDHRGGVRPVRRPRLADQLADRLQHQPAADAAGRRHADRRAALHGAALTQVVRDPAGLRDRERLDRLQGRGRHRAHDARRVLGPRTGPLVNQLQEAGAEKGRVEVVPARSHREASALAPYVNLARGWNRQADMERNPSSTTTPSTPRTTTSGCSAGPSTTSSSPRASPTATAANASANWSSAGCRT